jgi:PAS domain S-box-containing protein
MSFNLAEKIGSSLTGKVWVDATHLADLKGQIAAIQRALAVIEFSLDGTILTANDNFLNAMGYRLDEIRGKHHSLFVTAQERTSESYRQFWQKLGRGQFDQGQYPRTAKDGHTVWIQASYNPIFDADGRAYKVVKYATDVTAQVLLAQQMQCRRPWRRPRKSPAPPRRVIFRGASTPRRPPAMCSPWPSPAISC